jgi:hypothetical protein
MLSVRLNTMASRIGYSQDRNEVFQPLEPCIRTQIGMRGTRGTFSTPWAAAIEHMRKRDPGRLFARTGTLAPHIHAGEKPDPENLQFGNLHIKTCSVALRTDESFSHR